jgi:hypothetical protein
MYSCLWARVQDLLTRIQGCGLTKKRWLRVSRMAQWSGWSISQAILKSGDFVEI